MLQAGVPTAMVDGLGESGLRSPSTRYRKYELIGQGAQKKVYRAFDEERGIEVAWNEVAMAELARFREKDRQRVFAEIVVLKQLKHKNIMTLHDYWFDECRLMLIFITEIFPDGTLRQYRRRHKHADLPAIKRWAWQILQGLVYLHGHNPPIIHRDLKCDNIFVCGSSGIVKIGDLGLVTLCKDLSAPQSVLGTPEFMAPELYEEKYDEKVDVYAFGMCLLELATMEYPYEECKNAAQIYKKVTQGIPPASVEKLASDELRDFVMLCLCHDPRRRPEARELLKHSFFEAVRTTPPYLPGGFNGGCNGSYGTPPKLLTVVSSVSVSSSSTTSRPVILTSAASATAAALAAATDELSPTALSRTASSSSGVAAAAAEVGGDTAAAGGLAAANTALGSIAAAAVEANGSTAPTSPMLSVRSTSVELPHPLGAVAALLSPQPLSPVAAATNGMHAVAFGDQSSGCGGVSAAVKAVPVPALSGSIAAAATGASGAQLGVSPLSMNGLGSIASSLSPTAGSGWTCSGFAAAVGTGAGGMPAQGMPIIAHAAATSSPALPCQHAGVTGPSSPASALAAAMHNHHLSPSPPPDSGDAAAVSAMDGGCAVQGSRPSTREFASAVGMIADVYGRCAGGAMGTGGDSYPGRPNDGRPHQYSGSYGGMSASAAAIAAAAVSAAAAAVGASSNGGALGLPAIHEDHELHEDMMFDQEDCGRGGKSDSDEDDNDAYDDDGHRADYPAAAAVPAMLGVGGRSQPVSLHVRSSGHAAVANMALSFAMSFTNQRGVHKKVGFQYDLLHDTASAIAVEMVENLSLNTAEADAIAAMIQHEVSRFNLQQQEHQNQQQQQVQP